MVRRGSGGALFEPAQERRDRELTLGPATLAIFGIGLLALCGICFVFGYAVGHRSSGEAPITQVSSTTSSALAASNQPKPSATEDGFQPSAASDSDGSTTPASGGTTAPPTGAPAASAPASPAPAVVQTALPASQTPGQQIQSSGVVHPALPQGSSWVVQVAAVSQQEDAEVLLSALRKRGYSVSVRHDPADNLMHVQVGPFGNHNDAAAMRQRLLNDGYNAIIEP